MATDDPDVFAVGECVEHRGVCYGLVAPLYEMARVLAARLAGDATARYGGMALSTRLKVTGIDLFSAGDFAEGEGREEIVLRDPARSVYRRLVIEGNRRSEEHTSELQSLMRHSYAVLCLKQK